MSLGDVYSFKLINTEEIIGRLYEVTPEGEYIIEYPMLIGEKISNGIPQIVLQKYLQFSDNNLVNIKFSNVICLSDISHEFTKYYYNSIEFNAIYIDKSVDRSIRETNIAIENILQNNDKKFNEIAEKHNVDLSQFDMTVSN